ncbi:hypothetical protein HII36_46030 [Nonomuraea sp. NN258]|uniref:hypothetical protein n=1 Tax=Nonomuraea antri TaxID=2730852 RepID=UPI001567E59C|nr:hypothetical protein [Nonomuraea antri]NRQ39135.1 hypothetical protein [Nonomuraea antri]
MAAPRDTSPDRPFDARRLITVSVLTVMSLVPMCLSLIPTSQAWTPDLPPYRDPDAALVAAMGSACALFLVGITLIMAWSSRPARIGLLLLLGVNGYRLLTLLPYVGL